MTSTPVVAPFKPVWKSRFAALKAAIDDLPQAFEALQACALVEVTTGMVLHSTGALMEDGALAEAASNYWRIYQRHGSFFETLGPLRYCVLMHQQMRMTIVPCTADMVLVLLSQDGVVLNWQAVLAQAAQIGRLARQL